MQLQTVTGDPLTGARARRLQRTASRLSTARTMCGRSAVYKDL